MAAAETASSGRDINHAHSPAVAAEIASIAVWTTLRGSVAKGRTHPWQISLAGTDRALAIIALIAGLSKARGIAGPEGALATEAEIGEVALAAARAVVLLDQNRLTAVDTPIVEYADFDFMWTRWQRCGCAKVIRGGVLSFDQGAIDPKFAVHGRPIVSGRGLHDEAHINPTHVLWRYDFDRGGNAGPEELIQVLEAILC
jgi:hypothetical protein